MHTAFVAALIATFENNAHAENAWGMKKYMRNQFEFYGIKTPLRKKLLAEVLKEIPVEDTDTLGRIALSLYEKPQRECQYAAVDLLYAKNKRLNAYAASLLEQLITTKSWWDTVDNLAGKVAGALFARYPVLVHEVVAEWRKSSNMWLRRSCLLYQLRYKAHTDTAILVAAVRENAHAEEFFIQKAIGWALRQYAYTNPTEVLGWVEEIPLQPLSRREALRVIAHKDTDPCTGDTD